jgi:hypothetical protein
MNPKDPNVTNRVADNNMATVNATPVVHDGNRPAVNLPGARVATAVLISWLPRTLCDG